MEGLFLVLRQSVVGNAVQPAEEFFFVFGRLEVNRVRLELVQVIRSVQRLLRVPLLAQLLPTVNVKRFAEFPVLHKIPLRLHSFLLPLLSLVVKHLLVQYLL